MLAEEEKRFSRLVNSFSKWFNAANSSLKVSVI